MVLAIPAGMLLGHTGRGGGFTVVLSNVSRAVPTLALLTIFAVTPIGFGPTATTIALAVFAVPPILTNTYVGFRGVDRDVVEASAMGFSEWQVATKVELPLASPLLMTGVRTAAVQVVATATRRAGRRGRTRPHHHARFPPAGLRRGPRRSDPGRPLAILTELVLSASSWALTPGQRRLPFLQTRPVARTADPALAAPPL